MRTVISSRVGRVTMMKRMTVIMTVRGADEDDGGQA